MKKTLILLLLVTIPIVFAYSNTSNLVSEWKLDIDTNDTYDLNDLNNSGVTITPSCFLGDGCATFVNSTLGYLAVPTPNGLDANSEYSIVFWTNLTNEGWNGATMRAIHMNGVYSLNFVNTAAATTQSRFRAYNSTGGTVELSVSTTYAAPYNQWLMVATTYKSGNMSYYYNDTLRNSVGTLIGGGRDQSVPLYIGIDEDLNTGPYNGQIKDITFWNKSLTPTEISTIYSDYLLGIKPSDISNQCVYSGSGNFIQNNTICNITANISVESGYSWIIQNSTIYTNGNKVNYSNLKLKSGWLHWN